MEIKTHTPPKIYVSWFPGCCNPETLEFLTQKTEAEGIETRHLDDCARRIADSELALGFHLPTPPGEAPRINLADGSVLEPFRDGRMKDLVLTDLPFFGLHLGYSCLKVRKNVGPDLADSPTLSRAETAERICDSLVELQRLTGKRVLIENLDYGPTGAMEYVCEPEFAREVCEQSGAGFLWDIAHARVSAKPMGLEEDEYLHRFVTDLASHVAQIHINSPKDGKDAHLPPTDIEHTWLKRILDAGARPEVVTLERAWGEEKGITFARRLKPELSMLRASLR